MKKYYLMLSVALICSALNAQIINFTDADLKTKLLGFGVAKDINGVNIDIDLNDDGEIDQQEALLVYRISAGQPYNITNLGGIEYFTNLRQLMLNQQPIANIDLTVLPQLEIFENSAGNLYTLEIHGMAQLRQVSVYTNHLQHVDFTGLSNLTHFTAYNNDFTGEVDLSPCVNLLLFKIEGNNLTSLNIKNGKAQIFGVTGSLFTFTNLRYVCVDEEELDAVVAKLNSYPSYNGTAQINSYCSFVPGGTYYTVQGNTNLDLNNNGCDINDSAFPRLKFNISDGTNAGSFVPQTTGNYILPVIAGSHTIAPVLENPNYFNISPASATATFPLMISPQTRDFCVTPNGIHPDVEITVLPMANPRPGFDAMYQIVIRNKGNQTQSGMVNYVYNEAVLDFVNAMPSPSNQTASNLYWNFSNLLPFESLSITVTLNLNSPTDIPAVNAGYLLQSTATIDGGATDETPEDNVFVLNQTAFNSFDPNDKTCLEGNTVTPETVGKYVHYMIRFENTGTANAENIVVKDMIDTEKFDISSLIPIDGSHPFVTRISAGNKVEFIFENIQLPFDDANNDGYIAFKIKTKPNLVLGDTFSNTANIYFDYNFPIVTNTATTTVALLANQDFEFADYFKIYPVPVTTVLNIDSKKSIEVSSINIYNTLGQILMVIPNAQQTKSVDVSSLKSGNYFVKINSDKGGTTAKFVKL